MADSADNFGRSLECLPQTAAHLVLVAVGALTAAASVFARRGGRTASAVRVAAIGGLILLLDASVLAVFGYVPFLTISLLTGHAERLSLLASPSLLVELGVAAGAASLLWMQVARATANAPGKEPEAAHERAAARTRRWTVIAMAVPLGYAISRFLMVLQVPGFALDDGSVGTLAPSGLAAAATGGAVLTWGLIRPWGNGSRAGSRGRPAGGFRSTSLWHRPSGVCAGDGGIQVAPDADLHRGVRPRRRADRAARLPLATVVGRPRAGRRELPHPPQNRGGTRQRSAMMV
ncbi:hypothetical protein [Saccharopolyspora hattusasensis]|uniref:hypothetical protein n=1 Tax=Saccharopolyspora hattusasensis TaxID=1128679 RepID=UPI003D97701E